jgi:hypothetical protein
LLILAGPGAKALIAMVMPIASSVAPLVHTLLEVPF